MTYWLTNLSKNYVRNFPFGNNTSLLVSFNVQLFKIRSCRYSVLDCRCAVVYLDNAWINSFSSTFLLKRANEQFHQWEDGGVAIVKTITTRFRTQWKSVLLCCGIFRSRRSDSSYLHSHPDVTGTVTQQKLSAAGKLLVKFSLWEFKKLSINCGM